MAIVNTRLLSHPMNYVIILVMALFGGALGHLLLTLAGMTPATKAGAAAKSSAWNAMPAGQAPGEERAGAISPQSASLSGAGNY